MFCLAAALFFCRLVVALSPARQIACHEGLVSSLALLAVLGLDVDPLDLWVVKEDWAVDCEIFFFLFSSVL